MHGENPKLVKQLFMCWRSLLWREFHLPPL